MPKYLLFVALTVSLAPAAISQGTRTARTGVNNDPNQIVCRTEREIGSRLRGTRVCRTRAEWTEYRRQTRQAVEKAQHDIQSASSN